jgi:outer membrane murein-binding lipoprotein Lpp
MKTLANIFAVILAAFLLTSCGTTARKLTLAERCAKEYPCADTVIVVERTQTDTLYLAGYDQIDTVSVPCPPNLTDTVLVSVVREVRIPGRVVPVTTIVRDTVTARIDSALRVAYAELNAAYQQLEKDAAQAKTQLREARRSGGRSWWPWLLVGVLVALVAYLVFVKKK